MADRGFDGTIWTRAEFEAHLASITLPSRIKGVTIHCVAVPMSAVPATTKSTDYEVDAAQRVKNMYTDVRDRLKGVGFHVIVFENGQIGKGTPMTVQGNHAGSWNAATLGCEMYFDGDRDVATPGGQIILDTAAWWAAQILKKIGAAPSKDTVRFHRDEPAAKRNGKACPGKKVNHDDFLRRVSAEMGLSAPVEKARPAEKPVSAQLYDVKDIQTHLKRVGIDPGPIDGLIGPKTIAGIKQWQERLKIEATGLLGPWAYDRLKGAPSAVSEAPKAPEQTTNELHTSPKGLALIKHFEGLRLAPYDDNGSLAIGYGHSNRSKKPPVVTSSLRITEKEAEEILARDLIDYENRVKSSIKVPLTQHQFDALVSIAYNWGPGNLDRSELKDFVNAGKHKEAEAEIRTILPPSDKKYFAGIKRRRNQEADLYGGK
jgi:GH24 family phage-related lysozyme (muramidase)